MSSIILAVAETSTAPTTSAVDANHALVAMSPGQVLVILLLAGLMGLFGQGIRAVIGLKSMVDDAAANDVSASYLFSAARLLISLTIGFLAGIAAAFAIGVSEWKNIADVKTLLGLAAAGYAGTDAIEGFISKYLPTTPSAPLASGTPGAADKGQPTDPKAADKKSDDDSDDDSDDASSSIGAVSDQIASVQAQLSSVVSNISDSSLPTLSAKIDEVHALLTTVAVPAGAVHAGDITAGVTALIVKKMFPATPLPPISRNLPFVLDGLRWAGLTDRDMVNMALSTIRAETEGFVPISEGRSRFNTLRTPFDLYEPGTKVGIKLGNTRPGDGPLFKGRGFVQLTGRSNYETTGPEVDADLVANPDLANAPATAGKILAQFLKNHEQPIRVALAKGDLKTARKLVNGGSNGLVQFSNAFELGQRFLPS